MVEAMIFGDWVRHRGGTSRYVILHEALLDIFLFLEVRERLGGRLLTGRLCMDNLGPLGRGEQGQANDKSSLCCWVSLIACVSVRAKRSGGIGTCFFLHSFHRSHTRTTGIDAWSTARIRKEGSGYI